MSAKMKNSSTSKEAKIGKIHKNEIWVLMARPSLTESLTTPQSILLSANTSGGPHRPFNFLEFDL